MKTIKQTTKNIMVAILFIMICPFSFSQKSQKDLIIGTWRPEGSPGYRKVFEVNGVCSFYKKNILLKSSKWSIPTDGVLQLVDSKTKEVYKYELAFYPDGKIMELIFFPLPSKSMLYYRHPFSNTVLTTPFKKTNCGTGEGISLDYTVAAGTYSSAVSQQDADNQAKADVAKNGQKYVNAKGTCK